MIQVIYGTKIKMDGQTFKCVGFWCMGNKIVQYEFESASGFVFKRKADYIQELLKNKTIEKL